MESRKAGGWRRALKWTAIGIAVYIGWLGLPYVLAILSYAVSDDEPDYPSNFAINLTGRRVDLYQLDDGVFQAVGRMSGSGLLGLEGSCARLYVAFEMDGAPRPAKGTLADASQLADRTEIARTTDPLCGDDYWIIIEGGGRVIPWQQHNRESLDGPFVRNLVDDDVDLFTFEWDDPGVLTGVGRVPSDFLRRIPELVGEECVDLGLVAFAASGEAIPNPNVELRIGELADRSELGRTTEPLCLREYWLIEAGESRAVPESEYER
ncbi:MAG: hypothetical protein IH941_11785 [Acidobacteria bacterium]|nr:hypothetical protein [Acidobacteriota bacterium]